MNSSTARITACVTITITRYPLSSTTSSSSSRSRSSSSSTDLESYRRLTTDTWMWVLCVLSVIASQWLRAQILSCRERSWKRQIRFYCFFNLSIFCFSFLFVGCFILSCCCSLCVASVRCWVNITNSNSFKSTTATATTTAGLDLGRALMNYYYVIIFHFFHTNCASQTTKLIYVHMLIDIYIALCAL